MAALSGILALAALTLCASAGLAQQTRDDSNSNSNATSGSTSTSGANSNQRQTQGQSVTYQETTPADQTIKNVPNVYAPGLAAAGSEVCLGSVSAGGAGAGFGLTVGGTIVDQECQLRMNARTLATLGYAKAAREEMCLDPQVRSAMMAAGTPCVADEPAKPQATAEYGAPAAQSAAAAVELSSVPATPNRGCHKEYQLLGGWYDVCPPGAQTASADNLSAQATALAPEATALAPEATALAPQDSAPPAAPGCRKRYQLVGGWYDDCK
jgi:hypothetical protein